jgi:hypothetical protein
LGGAGFELVKERRELRPIAEVNVGGNEAARFVSGQFSERQ